MLATVLFRHKKYSATQFKTYDSIDDARSWVRDIEDDDDYAFIQILVDYSNVEFYKQEFDKYQAMVLELLTEKGHISKETLSRVLTFKD